jgi:hypothetical protein
MIPSLLCRRDLLHAGGVAVGASLTGGLAPPAANAAVGPKAKSVIFLWLAGGVTHHESFDPKPDAPQEIRGTLSTIQTPLPGVRFSEVMPRMARQTDKIALVRTFAAGTDDHFQAQARALSGRMVSLQQFLTEPNVGAVVSKLIGPRAGFPGYIAVPGTTRPGPPPHNLFVGGWLGRQYGPFMTGGRAKNEDFTAHVLEDLPEEEFTKQALRPGAGLSEDRLAGRSTLREKLDRALKQSESASAVGDEFRGAFDMLLSPAVRAAFDISKESDKVRELYGRTRIGTRCLLARRLVEAGAPFVMVDYGYDPEYGNLWDQHNAAGQNFPHVCEMAKRPYHLAGVDRAFAALLEDLALRGRLGQTLVVYLTDFGRTPKINKDGGRDHWGRAGSIFFAGGGVKGGQVIGTTDIRGSDPTTAAYTPADAAATIYTALGIDLATVLHDREGRDIPMLPTGRPIKDVL